MAKNWFMAAAVAAALVGSMSNAPAETPVKIGFHGALTGPFSVDGLGGQAAINIAVEKWNKAGGIKGHPIDLIAYDDQAKPDLAVPIANKLVGDDKVVAVLSSTLSEPTKAAAPFVNEAGIPYVSTFASSPDITKLGDFVFRVGILGELEGRAAAKTIATTLNKHKVVLLTVKSDLGKQVSTGFKEVAAQFHIDIVKEIEFSIQDRQFGPVIANIKELAPEAVFMTGYYFNGTFLPQLRSAGVDIPFVGMTSFTANQFLSIAGPAGEGALIVNVINWSNPRSSSTSSPSAPAIRPTRRRRIATRRRKCCSPRSRNPPT
jgi:branched-chain amino acid transport system substrate-binding protein